MVALELDAPAIPCGLHARSFFNDNYALYEVDGNGVIKDIDKPFEIDETGIAWDNDKAYQFKNIAEKPKEDQSSAGGNGETVADGKVEKEPVEWREIQWLDMEDEHFIVWMRNSGLPNFQKLWGHAKDGIKAGKYQLEVQSNYDVHQFQGHKSFVIAETNSFGGNQTILAICFWVLGATCWIVAAVLFSRAGAEPKAGVSRTPSDLNNLKR